MLGWTIAGWLLAVLLAAHVKTLWDANAKLFKKAKREALRWLKKDAAALGLRVLTAEQVALCREALRQHASFRAGETIGELPEDARAMWQLARELGDTKGGT